MASSSETDGDLAAILSEQRREFARAKALEADLDFAFQVQMQEAVTASLALPLPPSSSNQNDRRSFGSDGYDDVLGLAEAFLLSDMESYARELEDQKLCEAEMRAAREDVGRRIHDQRVAGDVATLPEDYWSKYGDWYEKPYGSSAASGSSSSSSSPENLGSGESLRLYFKGLVSEERVRDSNVAVAGAGIAICDPKDNLLFHSRKNLEAFIDGRVISGEMAELQALLAGLDKAIAFGFKRVVFFCYNNALYDYVTNRLRPRDAQTVTLLEQVVLLQRKLAYCAPTCAAKDTANHAFKSAREAIVSQISWSAETSKGKRLRETCVICFEDTDFAEMFSIDGCLHRYCFPCMKLHVEAKLHNGRVAKCPHDGCSSEVAIETCAKLLPPNLVEVMGQRMKESAIPVAQKVYCPDPKCSVLMSKSEVLEYTKAYFVGTEQSRARKCMSCQKFFCMDCKVPWHYSLTCRDYRIQNPHGDEQMLKSLATKKLWRQCAKCNHMVELLEGCYHITCRCGYEFCYTCGAEWKNKKATCVCPIWDEHNIIRDNAQRRQQPQPQHR